MWSNICYKRPWGEKYVFHKKQNLAEKHGHVTFQTKEYHHSSDGSYSDPTD